MKMLASWHNKNKKVKQNKTIKEEGMCWKLLRSQQ
jgi:hypothetical protein